MGRISISNYIYAISVLKTRKEVSSGKKENVVFDNRKMSESALCEKGFLDNVCYPKHQTNHKDEQQLILEDLKDSEVEGVLNHLS